MTTWLELILAVLSLAVVLVALWYVVRDRRVDPPIFAVVAVWWLACLVQLCYGLVALARTDEDVSGLVFVGYLVGLAAIPPVAWWWARGEPSRAGTGVLVVAGVVVPVLVLRLDAIWGAPGA